MWRTRAQREIPGRGLQESYEKYRACFWHAYLVKTLKRKLTMTKPTMSISEHRIYMVSLSWARTT